MTDDLRAQLNESLEGRYEVLEELLGGGMARVFVAEEKRLGRKVVIKVLPTELSADVSAERFEREIQLAAALQNPYVVPILTAGETSNGLPYYTMPFVEGESLRQRLERGSILFGQAVGVLRDVANALEAAHAHGVIHRDIKPGNVLLAGRTAVVTDFGIAKALSDSREAVTDATLTSAGMSIGTPAYMSPEQAAGDAIDPRSDIYSWGVLAYELFAGRHPFPDALTSQQLLSAHIAEVPAPLKEIAADVPADLAELVMRCLEKDAADRTQSATEVLAAMDAAHASAPAKLGLGKVRWNSRAKAFATAVAALVLVSGVLGRSQWRKAWARGAAVSEIEALAEDRRFEEGHDLAQRALAILPGDSIVENAASLVSQRQSIVSNPPGARVLRLPYLGSDSTWEFIGRTPLDVDLPRGWSRVRVESEGYREYETVLSGSGGSVTLRSESKAEPAGAMVDVIGGEVIPAYLITGLGHLGPQILADFRLGRFEVTNREFQEFVDQGGYERSELWEPDIRDGGERIELSEALSRFVDVTGRPGPASWELGSFVPGTEELPVGGVSWYEAGAYARFRGMQLPTIYHWMRGASSSEGEWILPLSNVEGTGPAPVGQSRGMSSAGALDVAGNVREWTENAVGSDRFVLGGSWGDPSYMFYHVNHMDPFDRSEGNGIRLADYEGDPSAVSLTGAVREEFRDFSTERPATDDVFAVYRSLYDYDAVPLEAEIEHADTTSEWIRERITYVGPDGQQRVPALLFLPRDGTPPFQTMVFFPGAQSLIGNAPIPEGGYSSIGRIVGTGRALIHPIYEGTYERRAPEGVGTWYPNATTAYRDLILTMGKELRRSVDFLETRPDLIDASRLSYMGISWGGYLSGLMMAIEPRLKAGALMCPGLTFAAPQPEVDPFHFLPRVTIPVLMVGGRHDAIFPYEASQLPMFGLLGSGAERKRHVVVEDAAHCPPRTVFIREALDWYDRFLGPVQR